MNAVPSTFHIHRHMDEAIVATNKALVAQHEIGRQEGAREAWMQMGFFCFCSFAGGVAFACGITALVRLSA